MLRPMIRLLLPLTLLAVAVAAPARGATPTTGPTSKPAVGDVPYRGWSSWTLQATTAPGYGKGWLTAAHVVEQADAMHAALGSHGYTYVNVDSGWAAGYDAYGRPTPNPRTFPDGIAAVAAHVHVNGQKLGLYLVPGLPREVFDRNPLVKGTPVHVADLVAVPHRPATAWKTNLAIDYAKPGAQAYVDSIAAQLADWQVDFLKFDGLTPGSDVRDAQLDARPDLAAMAAALRSTGRPVWLTASWAVDRKSAATWTRYANAFRINGDVERYGPTLCGWEQVARRFDKQADWQGVAGPAAGWTDLDSLIVATGDLDGLTADEKRTAVTFWAISCSPLYVGGDLTKMDDAGRALLTNDEVLALDAAGRPATRLGGGGDRQVWKTTAADGSTVVALFNLGRTPATVSATWHDLALARPVSTRDLWAHADFGPAADTLGADLAPHACRLVRLTPPRR